MKNIVDLYNPPIIPPKYEEVVPFLMEALDMQIVNAVSMGQISIERELNTNEQVFSKQIVADLKSYGYTAKIKSGVTLTVSWDVP